MIPVSDGGAMKKHILTLLLSAALAAGMCGCSGKQASGTPVQTDTSGAEQTTEAAKTDEMQTESADDAHTPEEAKTNYATGSPWIDSNIESNVYAAEEVSLKDHFDLAQNGQWVKENKIQPGKYRNAYLTSFEPVLRERLLDIMQQEPVSGDHDAKLVNTLYLNFVDWEARDAAGTEPLMPYLRKITDLNDISDLSAYIIGKDYRFSDVFSWCVIRDPDDSSRNILAVLSPDFFLNDTADYADLEHMSDISRRTYDMYREAVRTVLSKCGYTDEQIDDIYEGAIRFEQQVAQYCYTNDDLNLTATFDTINDQVFTMQELESYAWSEWLKKGAEAYGIDEIPAVQLYDKKAYFEQLNELICDDNLELIKDYLLAHTASASISMLDKEAFYRNIDLQNSLLGSTGYLPEDEYAVEIVSGALGWPLSKLYCNQYVTPQDKQSIRELIEQTIEGYKEMLRKEDFLSEATKDKAIEKLDRMTINCMYPDDWSPYDCGGLELSDNYFDALIEIHQYTLEREMSRFYDPVDKNLWPMVPIEQNACYSSSGNSINILPGLIGDVLYNSEMSAEEVYGKTGVLIGHEISHAFDPQGASYDADGNYLDWWTDEDKKNFHEKSDKMVAYYDAITVWDGLNCNGELNKTEACADMGGMAVMLHLAAQNPDFDYQKFFTSYANLWALNYTPEFTEYDARYDVHPLGYLRVNATVAQFQEFIDAFDIKEGDGMYIAPDDRVKIW